MRWPRQRLVVNVAAVVVFLMVVIIFVDPVRSKLVSFQSYINDYSDVIPESLERKLNAVLRQLENKTSVQVAVVVINSTEGVPAADYAVQFGQKWGVGQEGKDNGVVFLVAVQDRDMFIATGYGVESILPHNELAGIRDRDILPYFRKGYFASGVLGGVLELTNQIAKANGLSLESLVPRNSYLIQLRNLAKNNKAPFILAVDGFSPEAQVGLVEDWSGYLKVHLEKLTSLPYVKAHITAFPWSGDTKDTKEAIQALRTTYIPALLAKAKRQDAQFIIVAHSWGGLLAYRALRDLEGQLKTGEVDQLITLGSPINPQREGAGLVARRYAKEYLAENLKRPASVTKWTNYWTGNDNVSGPISVAENVKLPNVHGLDHSSYYKNTKFLEMIEAEVLGVVQEAMIAKKRVQEELSRQNSWNGFSQKYGVQELVPLNILHTNPYVYEGKTVAVSVIFNRMISRDTAKFSSGYGLHINVSGVPSKLFRTQVLVVLAIQVTKSKDSIFKFVGAHFCEALRCSDILPQ